MFVHSPVTSPKELRMCASLVISSFIGGTKNGGVIRIERGPKEGPAPPEAGEVSSSRSKLKGLLEWVDRNVKKERRERVTLPKASTMPNRCGRHPIKEDPRSGSTKDGGDPITKPNRETKMTEAIHKVIPSNGVKRFPDIELKEERGSLGSVKPSSKVPHKQEVIVDTSIFDEGALSGRDQRVHVRGEPRSQHLSNDFCDCVNQANGSEIRDAFGSLLFWNENNVCRI